MAHDLAWRRRFRAAFDPFRDLSPDECEHLYVGRPRAPSVHIIRALEQGAAEATRIALVGARGTGKSTELRQVMHRLGQEGAPLVPILIDIGEGLPTRGVSTASWLPVVAAAIRAARQDWHGAAPPSDPMPRALETLGITTELLDGLTRAVRVVGPWFGPEGLAASATLELLRELSGVVGRAARTASERPHSRAELEPLVQAIQAELIALQTAAGRSPALLLDGLDKLQSAETVFDALSDAELLYGLPAAVVITGPLQLQADGRLTAWISPGRFLEQPMYNLPVVHRDGAAKQEGIEPLLRLFERRWQASGLAPTFFTQPVLERAARWSSGIVREFLHLVREAGAEALSADRTRVTEADLTQAVRDKRHLFEMTMDSARWDALERVRQQAERPVGEHADLLFQNAVVCYQNDSVWYRPNELLIPYLDDRGKRRAPPTP